MNNFIIENEESIFDKHMADFKKAGCDLDKEDPSKFEKGKAILMVNQDLNGLLIDEPSFGIKRGRLELRKGMIYRNKTDNKDYELIEYLNESFEVVIRNLETNKTSIVNIESLENIKDGDNEHINVDISSIGDKEWNNAQEKFEVIKPIISTEYDNNHRQLVLKRSEETGVSIRTIYRWLKKYKSTGSVAGLVDRKRGWQTGNSRLTNEQDMVIQRAIKAFYLTKQRTSLEQTYREVFRICSMEGINKPSKKAIRLRIGQISEYEQLKKRGQVELARKKFKPTPHSFPNADYPLAVIQIDHTPIDLILVDDEHRKPIGRPFLTLAIDVFSRMVTGYYISLDAPSSTSVAMCIARSILPKNKLLLEYGLEGVEWNVFGYPQKIHVDNGADFRSNTLAKACEIHGINLEFRPVARPQFGGHIERLIGTFMKEVHGLEGTTFSNIREKDTYDSEKEAMMTLDEFETWFVTMVTKVYHQRVHSTLKRTPIEQWNIGIYGDKDNSIGIGLPAIPLDAKTLLLDFMPMFERTIQHFGVTIDGLCYYDHCLNAYINARNENGNKKQFIFRRDPRDISKLWFYDPKLHQYFLVPFANQQLPSMSLWEYKQVRKRISDKGEDYVSEHQVYEALTEMRDIVEQSSKKTKSARRQAERQKVHKKSQTVAAKTMMASVKAGSDKQNLDNYTSPEVSGIKDIEMHEKTDLENELLDDIDGFNFGDIE